MGQFFDGGNSLFGFRIVGSLDPNMKLASSGFGTEGYLTKDRTLMYEIHFENLKTATAPARDIYVTDTLDSDLDWSTLKQGASSHTPSTVQLDTSSGVLRWTFNSINLPPNLHPPEGEGYINFTIQPRRTVPSGTRITNRAAIVFDLNDPILTNEVLNTIDDLPPQSSVAHLAPEQNNVAFKLDWGGTDTESGVAWYQVFVSRDGGPFTLWTQTPKTSGVYIADNGHSYGFASLAVDNVGHAEAVHVVADATTRVNAEEDIGFSPNPFVPSRGHTQITVFGGKLPHAEVTVYTKAGLKVCSLRESMGETTLLWDGTNDKGEKLASGVYIWVLKGPAGESKGKFAIIR